MPTPHTADDGGAFEITVQVPSEYETVWPLQRADLPMDQQHPLAIEISPVRIRFNDDETAGLLSVGFGHPMTAKELRAIPWQQVIDGAVRGLVSELAATKLRTLGRTWSDLGPDERESISDAADTVARQTHPNRRRLTQSDLEEIARLVKQEGEDHAPAAVADAFYVSRRQANRYIARAREAGLIP